jgi:hypothetical protein
MGEPNETSMNLFFVAQLLSGVASVFGVLIGDVNAVLNATMLGLMLPQQRKG